jgi:hypothetical protein
VDFTPCAFAVCATLKHGRSLRIAQLSEPSAASSPPRFDLGFLSFEPFYFHGDIAPRFGHLE